MKQNKIGIIGMVCLLLTAGVIGYCIGGCNMDWELFGGLLLIYVPPIVGSICSTIFIMSNKRNDIVDKKEIEV